MMKNVQFEVSQEQFDKIFNKIRKDLTNGIKHSAYPQAFILGGQPGSGKTTIQQIIMQKLPDTIIINGDEFRKYHPRFDDIQTEFGKDSVLYTQPFSNKVVEALINKLSDEKYNLIIEGTLRTAEIPVKTCMDLKNKGYKTELSVMAVSAEASWQGTIDRYNKMLESGLTPRATPKESHDNVVNNIAGNLYRIYEKNCFDNITLFSREKVCLYDMSKTPEINPSALLQDVISGVKEKQNKPSLKAKLESAKKEASLSAPKISEKKSHNVQL